MEELINKIRRQPRPIRKRIILITAVAITGIIFLFWVYMLPYRFASSKGGGLKEDLKPFRLFGESISKSLNSIGNVVNKNQ